MKPSVSSLLSAPTSAATTTTSGVTSRSKQLSSAARCSASKNSSGLRRVFHCLSSAQGYLIDQSERCVNATLQGKSPGANSQGGTVSAAAMILPRALIGTELHSAPNGPEHHGAPYGATWTQDPARSLRFLSSDAAVSRAKALCHLYPDIAISVVIFRCASLGTWFAVDE